jgi:predicted permease
MGNLWQDFRYGVRTLLKRPGFVALAVLSLGLGIGANTAIFSLVNMVLFRPLPVAEPGRLYSVAVRGKDDGVLAFSYPNYVDFRDRNEALAGLVVHRFAPMSLSRNGQNERVWGYLVSGNYFDVLGVKAVIGRTFTPEEDRAKLASPVVVLSYGCWQRRFGADASIVGRDVVINGHSFRVVGVAPEGFAGTEMVYTPEIWVPMMMQRWVEPSYNWLDARGVQNIFATGRLKPGVTREQAEASLNLLAAQLGKEYPDENEGQRIELVPPGFIIPTLRSGFVSFSWVLMAAVGLVLLIACTNLANLLLARSAERRREVAVRLALGAGRWRLIRQLLTESILLSVAGGAVGVALAVWMLDLVAVFKPPVDFPLTVDLRVDWRVLAFAFLASLVTGVVFGLAPALQAAKTELVAALKDAASQSGMRRSRLRSGLVVAQLAFSLVLLIAAGLVVRALQQVQTMSPGFDAQNGLLASVDLGLQGYDEARGQNFQRQLVERVEAVPGVKAAALANFIPLSLNYSATNVFVEGQAPVRGANVPTAMYASVSPRYFEAMGIALARGREFTAQDNEQSTRVAVVNETFARKFFPGANAVERAVGKRVSSRGVDGPFMQIVGVARDGKYFHIGEDDRPFIYYPLRQEYEASVTLVVRSGGEPQALVGAVRGEVQKLDANLPVFGVKTMAEHLGLSYFPARVAAALLSSFGLLALALAGIGIYGVTSYAVAQRTREIGVRVALGARPRDVLRLVLGQGMILIGIGLASGLAAAFALTRLMTNVLYGVSATDPLVFAGVVLLLVGVALAACFIPARRAMKVDPMVALRYE